MLFLDGMKIYAISELIFFIPSVRNICRIKNIRRRIQKISGVACILRATCSIRKLLIGVTIGCQVKYFRYRVVYVVF